MALSTVQMFLASILFAITCNLMIANPIPPGLQTMYEVYAELVCQTNHLRQWEHKLLMDFIFDRFPNTEDVRDVEVPNLLLTDAMGIFQRRRASDIDILSNHRDYLLHYKYIIVYVLADEINTTSATNFISEMEDIKLYIDLTIAEIEDVMLHLDLSYLTKTETDIPVELRPFFHPEWEKNVITRHKRDMFVLQQIDMHLDKAYQDFSAQRNRFIQADTTPINCLQALPS